MQIEIDTSVTQLFVGVRLPTESTCTQCDHAFDETDHCVGYAIRIKDASAYTLGQLYCTECAPKRIPSPSLGISEYLFQSQLTRTLDHPTQREFQTLATPLTIDRSISSEGTPEPHSQQDTPTARIGLSNTDDRTNTIYHIERDNGTPLCHCSHDGEYARVSLAKAAVSEARCCHNCQAAREDRLDTCSCLHSSKQTDDRS